MREKLGASRRGLLTDERGALQLGLVVVVVVVVVVVADTADRYSIPHRPADFDRITPLI